MSRRLGKQWRVPMAMAATGLFVVAALVGPMGWGPADADPPLVAWQPLSSPDLPAIEDDPDYHFEREGGSQHWTGLPPELGAQRVEVTKDAEGWVHIRGLAIGWYVPARRFPAMLDGQLVSGAPWKVDAFRLPECYRPAALQGGPTGLTNPIGGGRYVTGYLMVGTDGMVSVKAYEGPTGGVDEVQSIDVDASDGTFTITISGSTTAPIDWDAPASEVQDALLALPGMWVGDMVVAQVGSGPYQITFDGRWALVDAPTLSTDASELTGGGASAAVAGVTAASSGTPGFLFGEGVDSHPGVTGSLMVDFALEYQTENTTACP